MFFETFSNASVEKLLVRLPLDVFVDVFGFVDCCGRDCNDRERFVLLLLIDYYFSIWEDEFQLLIQVEQSYLLVEQV